MVSNISFLTGTLSLKEANEVHLLRISSGGTELLCEGLFSHPNEIRDLSSYPFDQRIFSTVLSTGESYGAAIWKIPELYGQLNSPQLERIAALDAHVGKINCVLWWPSGRHDKLVRIDEENLFLWNLDCSNKTAQVQSKESSGMLHYLSGGAWDPHDVNAVGTTCELSVQFWDLRTMKKTNSIEHGQIRNLDYDTKKKHILNAEGTFPWDPWTYTLVIGFWTSTTLSTSNHDEQPSESLVESPIRRADLLLNSYSDYEDSVYGRAWSSC